MGVDCASSDSAADCAPAVLTCSDADTTKHWARQQDQEDELRSRTEDDVSKSPADEPEPSDVHGKGTADLVNGHERLEIVEPLPDCEERVSPECTTRRSEDQCNGLTAVPASAADLMESSSDAAREVHGYNGAIRFVDDDDDVEASSPADAAAAAPSCGLGDGEPAADSWRHRVVDEEVDGRGMLFSENDVELGAGGEREWTRRVSSRVFFVITFTAVVNSPRREVSNQRVSIRAFAASCLSCSPPPSCGRWRF